MTEIEKGQACFMNGSDMYVGHAKNVFSTLHSHLRVNRMTVVRGDLSAGQNLGIASDYQPGPVDCGKCFGA